MLNFIRYYDDAPVFTGLLFISNKLEMYGLSAAFMMDFFNLTNFFSVLNIDMAKDNLLVIANKFCFIFYLIIIINL